MPGASRSSGRTGNIQSGDFRLEASHDWNMWMPVLPRSHLAPSPQRSEHSELQPGDPSRLYSLVFSPAWRKCSYLLCADLPASLVRVTRNHVVYELADFFGAAPGCVHRPMRFPAVPWVPVGHVGTRCRTVPHYLNLHNGESTVRALLALYPPSANALACCVPVTAPALSRFWLTEDCVVVAGDNVSSSVARCFLS